MQKIKYRSIRGYKYILAEMYQVQTDIRPKTAVTEPAEGKIFIRLDENGILTVYEGYAWDGPSGPTFDTKNFMRGSLIHDALYQLIRQDRISDSYRKYADMNLYTCCIDDGMSEFRASYVYQAVRMFGNSSAEHLGRPETESVILEAP